MFVIVVGLANTKTMRNWLFQMKRSADISASNNKKRSAVNTSEIWHDPVANERERERKRWRKYLIR